MKQINKSKVETKEWICTIEKHREGDYISCIHKEKETSICLFGRKLRSQDLKCKCDKSGTTECKYL